MIVREGERWKDGKKKKKKKSWHREDGKVRKKGGSLTLPVVQFEMTMSLSDT